VLSLLTWPGPGGGAASSFSSFVKCLMFAILSSAGHVTRLRLTPDGAASVFCFFCPCSPGGADVVASLLDALVARFSSSATSRARLGAPLLDAFALLISAGG
jgi:hypothetical protein